VIAVAAEPDAVDRQDPARSSPLHAWHAHPRLNPDYRHDDDTKFDVGNIAHKLMLGRGKDIVVLDFDDWRTKAAKERARRRRGRQARRARQARAAADRMVKAAREQLDARGLGHLFGDQGDGEVVAGVARRGSGCGR
jgi:hypothetical protein